MAKAKRGGGMPHISIRRELTLTSVQAYQMARRNGGKVDSSLMWLDINVDRLSSEKADISEDLPAQELWNVVEKWFEDTETTLKRITDHLNELLEDAEIDIGDIVEKNPQTIALEQSHPYTARYHSLIKKLDEIAKTANVLFLYNEISRPRMAQLIAEARKAVGRLSTNVIQTNTRCVQAVKRLKEQRGKQAKQPDSKPVAVDEAKEEEAAA